MAINLELIRSRLEGEREHLTRDLEQLVARGRPADERREGSPFGKREEEATEAADLETRLELERRTRDQMAAVEHALAKIDAGTYGFCDVCGQPINPERLEALPQASLCLDCKAKQAKDAKAK